MTDLDVQLQLNDLRLRILNKQAVKPEEMRLVLDNLRQGRMKAMREDRSATRKSKKAITAPVDLDSLFS